MHVPAYMYRSKINNGQENVCFVLPYLSFDSGGGGGLDDCCLCCFGGPVIAPPLFNSRKLHGQTRKLVI